MLLVLSMPAQVITHEDLMIFKDEMISEIRKLLGQQPATSPKWLKSHEVRRLLKISPGTLQNLRVNGTLPFTKIGGVLFYDAEDIQKVLFNNKRVSSSHAFSLEKTFAREAKTSL